MMSRMSELDAAVVELRKCGESLITVSETLRALFSGDAPGTDAEVQEPAKKPQPDAKPRTRRRATLSASWASPCRTSR